MDKSLFALFILVHAISASAQEMEQFLEKAILDWPTRAVGDSVDAKRQGKWHFYNSKDDLIFEVSYSDGKIDGEWKYCLWTYEMSQPWGVDWIAEIHTFTFEDGYYCDGTAKIEYLYPPDYVPPDTIGQAELIKKYKEEKEKTEQLQQKYWAEQKEKEEIEKKKSTLTYEIPDFVKEIFLNDVEIRIGKNFSQKWTFSISSLEGLPYYDSLAANRRYQMRVIVTIPVNNKFNLYYTCSVDYNPSDSSVSTINEKFPDCANKPWLGNIIIYSYKKFKNKSYYRELILYQGRFAYYKKKRISKKHQKVFIKEVIRDATTWKVLIRYKSHFQSDWIDKRPPPTKFEKWIKKKKEHICDKKLKRLEKNRR